MKDLYTFDATPQKAMLAYETVREAYDAFFKELKIPYLAAEADSGEIGGELSHEYHVPTSNGEDSVISCSSCSYVANEEVARSREASNDTRRICSTPSPYQHWYGISKDRTQLLEAILPKRVGAWSHPELPQQDVQVNPYLIKSLFPYVDLSVENPVSAFARRWYLFQNSSLDIGVPVQLPRFEQVYDYRVPQAYIDGHNSSCGETFSMRHFFKSIGLETSLSKISRDLARIQTNDECPRCRNRSLKLQRAVELGHTFYLGDRYSRPLQSTFTRENNQLLQDNSLPTNSPDLPRSHQSYLEMGCFGIGLSRTIAAVADLLADAQGLNWPRAMAPFEVVIIATKELTVKANEIWDNLASIIGGLEPIDAVLDDRDKDMGWRLKDADLIGFPVVIVLGSIMRKEGKCEVIVRRHGTREKVCVVDIKDYVTEQLAPL